MTNFDFRISQSAFDFIVDKLMLHWKGQVNIETAVQIFLYDISTGETQRSLASRFGVVKSTVKKYTVYVASLINAHLSYFVSHQIAQEDVDVQQFLFKHHYGQPDAIAAMDGVFIPIKRPAKQGGSYFSGHKKKYGLMMLAVCDYHCRFLYIVFGNSARIGDSLVFNTSRLKRNRSRRNYIQ